MNLSELGNILKRNYQPGIEQCIRSQQVILNGLSRVTEPTPDHNINVAEMMSAANKAGFGEMVSMDFSTPLRGSACYVIKWEMGMGWAFEDFWHFCDDETFLKGRLMRKEPKLLVPASPGIPPQCVVQDDGEGKTVWLER